MQRYQIISNYFVWVIVHDRKLHRSRMQRNKHALTTSQSGAAVLGPTLAEPK